MLNALKVLLGGCFLIAVVLIVITLFVAIGFAVRVIAVLVVAVGVVALVGMVCWSLVDEVIITPWKARKKKPQ